MNPSRKSIFWTIATLAVAMLPQLPRMPLTVAALALLPLGWRLLAEIREWQPVPSLVRHSVTAIALLTLYGSFGNLAGRRAAVSLLTVMLAFKLIEAYRIRDARLVVSFSLFLCATQFLFTQGIMMPVYGAATVMVALVALTQLQRNEAFETSEITPPVAASVSSEMGFSFRLLGLAIPIGLAFFLLFPRWSTPLWGIPESTLDARTGLSESMAPGSIQGLFMDDSPAFRVEFKNGIPPQAELYWRGPVFWNFDGKTWSGSYFSKNLPAESVPLEERATWQYRVQMEPNERHWLFALDYPAVTPPDSRLTVDYQILRRKPVTQLFQYSMSSRTDFVDSATLTETLRDAALDLPENYNPKTRDLVRQWQRQGYKGTRLVEHALDHFNREPFHYSLDSPLLGRDSVDEFMFNSRSGYCEHYASAFTVMMRMAGIPARVVTGYMGGWYNDLGDYLLVRQSDAHAWSEVWFPGTGWSRVDPTAAVSPMRVAQGSLGALSAPRHLLDFAWLRRVRNGVDIVQQRWNEKVIQFGADRQSRMLAPLGLNRMSPALLVTMLFAVIGLLSVILVPFVFRVKGPRNQDALQVAWQTFLKRLKEAGYEATASNGAMEIAHSASRRLPADADDIQVIADLYNRARYSSRPPGLSEFRDAVRQFHPKK
jgi:transglutaminase-like putative cysteine protease